GLVVVLRGVEHEPQRFRNAPSAAAILRSLQGIFKTKERLAASPVGSYGGDMHLIWTEPFTEFQGKLCLTGPGETGQNDEPLRRKTYNEATNEFFMTRTERNVADSQGSRELVDGT